MPTRLPWLLLAAAVTPLTAAETLVTDVSEFDKAMKAAQAGDTIVMRAGEWRDADLRFRGTGTPEAPIKLRAQTPGKTVLTGKSRLRIGGRHLEASGLWFQDPGDIEVIEFRIDSKNHARDCRLTECAVTLGEAADGVEESRWANLYGTRNRIDHCHFQGKNNEGTTLVVWLGSEPDGNHRIDHNYFGPRPRLGENGGESIRIGDSKTSMRDGNCLVERNLFEKCNGEVEIISNKSCANTYRANLFLECEGTLTLRHGNRCLVEGNWFFGNDKRYTGGIRVIGEDHRVMNNYLEGIAGDDFRSGITLMNGLPDSPDNGYFQVKRAVVAFNTLVNCNIPILVGVPHDKKCILSPVESIISANVIQAPDAEKAIDLRDPKSEVTWKCNLAQAEKLGVEGNEGVLAGKPGLARGADQLYRPSADSPVAGAAKDVEEAPALDIDGQPRSGALDAGCDQISDAPIQSKPVSRDETGPSWKRD